MFALEVEVVASSIPLLVEVFISWFAELSIAAEFSGQTWTILFLGGSGMMICVCNSLFSAPELTWPDSKVPTSIELLCKLNESSSYSDIETSDKSFSGLGRKTFLVEIGDISEGVAKVEELNAL